MKHINVFLVIICFLIGYSTCADELPKAFQRCSVSNKLDNQPNECLKNAIQDAIVLLSTNNYESLNIGDLDPLKLSDIIMNQASSSGVVQTQVNFTNNIMYGLKDTRVVSVNGKLSSPEDFKLILQAFADTIRMEGPYVIGGNILNLPIEGQGISNMTLYDVNVTFTINGEPQTIDGKEHLKITSTTFNLNPSRITINLSNLLNDNLNSILNQNWQIIYVEIQPLIETIFADILGNYSKQILETTRFKKIFRVTS